MKISVVITTFNRKYEVRRAIETVYAQTAKPYEIIVVDDASNDGTEAYLKQFSFIGLQYYRCEDNQGASAARNYGISKATGDYIAFLDSDDEWYPEKIETLNGALSQMSELYDVICTHYIRREAFENVIHPKSCGTDLKEEIFVHNIANASASIYNLSVLRSIGGFSIEYQVYADWELLLRMSKSGSLSIVLLEEVLSKNWTMHNSLSENTDLLEQEKIKLRIEYPKVQI